MSKIERYQGNVHAFASGAQGVERTVFGETTQANDLTSQITAAFLRGWGIVGPSEHPSLEDFNGAMYALSQFIAYQHQAGIPEWHEEQEYYVGSICTHDGESYQSLVDSNVGNEPPSTAWTPILTSNNGLQNLGLKGAAKCDVGATAGTVAAGDDSRFGLMLGVGQTWQDLSASRALSVTYTNSTGKPIMVFASTTVNATSPTSTLSVNNIPTSIAAGSNWPTNFIMRGALVAIVPSGGTYRVDGGFSLSQWTELR